MFDLKDLYQEVIIDHNRRPRNFHTMDAPAARADGYNPLCGDQLTVYLEMDGDRIVDLSFQGEGCAISVASASLMTEQLKGHTRQEARALFERFHDLVTDREAPLDQDGLGKLAALAGVREYPARVKCATLCWHTLNAALAGESTATTE